MRGGTAECAEELGKLQLEARRLLSVSVPGVRLRRRQVLGPRRKRQRSTACSPASAACRRFGCGCRADSCSCAQGGEGHRATARGRGQNGRAARQEANPTREPRVAHSGHPHSPWPGSLPTAPPQLACPTAACLWAGTHARRRCWHADIPSDRAQSHGPARDLVNFRLGSRLRRPNCHSCEHTSCAVCVVSPFLELKVAVLGPKIADFFLAGLRPAPRWGCRPRPR